MPQQDDLERWLAALGKRADAHSERPLHPSLIEFRELIDSDPVVRMYVHQMIEQEPGGSRKYSQRHIDDVPRMLALMNEVLISAPEFDEEGMVMTPLNAVLDWTMGTPAGFAAYRDRRINDALRKVLRGSGRSPERSSAPSCRTARTTRRPIRRAMPRSNGRTRRGTSHTWRREQCSRSKQTILPSAD